MVTMEELKTPAEITWCPGCGNFGMLTAFKKALVELGIPRENVVMVSGIGCHGKMVNHVNINGFHGLHGRVIPLASGIKLANPELTVVGFSGDGDCYEEGWEHLSHGLRRNLDITIIVHDNMVFGLTTGQTTATSQKGFKSKSTPFGAIPLQLNPLAVALTSHATFVARGFAGDMAHLQRIMVEAIRHRGFSLVDVFQPCVTFNYLNTWDFYRKRVYKLEEAGHDPTDWAKALEKAMEWGDRIPIGILYKEERPTYQDELVHLGGPVAGREIGEVDIGPLMKAMT